MAGGLQPLHQHLRHALGQFITKGWILLRLGAQTGAIKEYGLRPLQRARVEMPAIRREKPRPAQHVAGADGLDWRRDAVGVRGLESHRAVQDEVKPVRLVAFAENNLTRLKYA